MKTYIGTKVVKATPMQAHEFATKHKRDNLNVFFDADGYEIQYEDGYTSWSPKKTFEKAYKKVTEDEAFAQEKSVGFWGGFASRRGQERNEAIKLLRQVWYEQELHDKLTTGLLEEIGNFLQRFEHVQ